MDILMILQQEFPKLTHKEQSVAEYILQNSDYVASMTIGDLAQEIGTSNATITRFCKKLGCSNFVDFKLQIHAVANPVVDKEPDEISEQVFQYYNTVIKNTQSLIKKNEIMKFIDLVNNATSTSILGIGSSGDTAKTFAQRMMRMGYNVSSYYESHSITMRCTVAKSDEVMIVISNSGKTRELYRSVREAKKRGCKIIAITSFIESDISQISDLVLLVYNTMFIKDRKFINSQFALMYFIDVLTTYLQEDEEAYKRIQETRESIEKLRKDSKF